MSDHSESGNPQTQWQSRRQRMVASQIAARGIRSPAVLEAMGRVPRERFLPEDMREFACDDAPLPIAEGQTISQPYIVAYMIDALQLRGGERVLEIGTGSGYAAAVLGEIAGRVYTIERHASLARHAAQLLNDLGYDNIEVIEGDGTLGWPAAAPYQGIVVTAGGPEVPASLKRQLAVGGRLVIPVGQESRQVLLRVTRTGEDDYQQQRLADVRFVPLVGTEGWEGHGAAVDETSTRPAETGCRPGWRTERKSPRPARRLRR